LVKNNFELDLESAPNTVVTLDYFLQAMSEIKDYSSQSDVSDQTKETYEIEKVSNFPILNDVYYKLKNLHYDSDKLKDEDLVR